jgi:hypothetical protein
MIVLMRYSLGWDGIEPSATVRAATKDAAES